MSEAGVINAVRVTNRKREEKRQYLVLAQARKDKTMPFVGYDFNIKKKKEEEKNAAVSLSL